MAAKEITAKIALIGAANSGKTSLLAAFAQSCDKQSHGFSSDTTFKALPDPIEIEDNRDFQPLLGHEGTDIQEIFSHQSGRYTASVNRNAGGFLKRAQIAHLSICEVPLGDTLSEDMQAAVVGAEHLVLTIALDAPDITAQIHALANMIDALENEKNFKSINLVWTKCDLVFEGSHQFPALIASGSDNAADLISFLTEADPARSPALLSLRESAAQRSKADIEMIAVSAYGFWSSTWDVVRGKGETPTAFFKALYGEQQQEKWLPYLASDPFLMAAFGDEGHKFTTNLPAAR